MSKVRRGDLQAITFAVEQNQDQRTAHWVRITIKRGDTVQAIARRRKHPEDAAIIARKNDIRNVNSKLYRKTIQVPKAGTNVGFSVMAGNEAPRIVAGYQKLAVVSRPSIVGLTVFDGYDPITMEIPIRFEGRDGDGLENENDIRTLEAMAGRGPDSVHGRGPAPILHVSASTPDGKNRVPLIPSHYQRDLENKTGPLWRIAGIEWDANPLRNRAGNRVRQLAVVTVQEYTRLSLLSRSATARSKAKKKTKK
jgi:hypothetical protein